MGRCRCCGAAFGVSFILDRYSRKKKKPIEKNRADSEGAPLGKKLIIGKTGLFLHRSRDTGQLAELLATLCSAGISGLT